MSNQPADLRPEKRLSFQAFSKLPVILQTEAAECGLACLAMISGYYGFKTDLTSIRHQFSISSHGATLKQIMEIANKLDLSSRALRLEVEHLEQLQTPCILHWDMKHFVVLKKVTKTKVIIHDPAIGERVLSKSVVDRSFTGVALELTPAPSFVKGEAKQSLTLSHFWTRIIGLKRSLTLILSLSLLLQLFVIINPFYMQTVIDDVILRSDVNLLLILALGFGLLLVIDTGTNMLRQYVILQLSSKLNIQMAANVFHHLIRLPLDYFSKRHMGDVVSRFSSLQNIRELMTTGLVSVVVDGLMASITLVVMFLYDAKLTCIVLAVVFLYGLLRYVFYRPIRMLNEERIVADAKENSHFMESVRAIQTIKLFEKETDRQNQWQNNLAEAINKDIKLSRWGIGFESANKFLFGLENIVIIYFAAMAVIDNLLTVGMLYAFISYKNRFINSMDELIAKWIEFKMLDLHFDRLADIVFTPVDQLSHPPISNIRLPGSPKQANQRLKGDIEVQNLSFTYAQTDKPIFQGLNFSIKAGETVAIVGPSGVGKSTLLKCMMGLLRPSEGQVLVDSNPIHQIKHYRKEIAAVLQDDQLLSGSIAENIGCFDAKIDIDQIVFAANSACIHEEIMQTSMQYNTLVGDMGASISGGQKQRIMLARALYKKPSILFMDEATSHLDGNNEAKINAHIRRMSITRVVIAHRTDTVNSADRILQLAEGKLIEINQDAVNNQRK
jgi:ATP-binding cassette subfamily B protein RaxB